MATIRANPLGIAGILDQKKKAEEEIKRDYGCNVKISMTKALDIMAIKQMADKYKKLPTMLVVKFLGLNIRRNNHAPEHR